MSRRIVVLGRDARVEAAGRLCLDIPIALPGLGLLTHYRGWLAPQPVAEAEGAAEPITVATR